MTEMSMALRGSETDVPGTGTRLVLAGRSGGGIRKGRGGLEGLSRRLTFSSLQSLAGAGAVLATAGVS